jgi:hypothetical protein
LLGRNYQQLCLIDSILGGTNDSIVQLKFTQFKIKQIQNWFIEKQNSNDQQFKNNLKRLKSMQIDLNYVPAMDKQINS